MTNELMELYLNILNGHRNKSEYNKVLKSLTKLFKGSNTEFISHEVIIKRDKHNIYFPATVNGQVVGTYMIVNPKNKLEENELLFIIEALNNMHSNIKDYDNKLYKMEIDRDTKLKNYKAYEVRLQDFKNKDRLPVSSLGLILIDVNRLHIINDTYGFKMGDLLLKKVGNSIREVCTMSTDYEGYRINGDEFAIILKDSLKSTVTNICSKLKKDINDINLTNDLKINVSIGCSHKKSKFDISELVKEASDNLLVDKIEYYNKNNINRNKR